MATVIGVTFKKAGKMYYFDPGQLQPQKEQYVIVETARGLECGEVVTCVKEVPDEELVTPLKAVLRIATSDDIRRMEDNKAKEAHAFEVAQERILTHNLEMKLVSVEYTFDLSKIVFYFTANGRVDFRELVKDLASVFKTRIELRQIGVRDEAKMIGGLGACGRPICCASFLGDFHPVSIKMAKEQNLLLNPTKISGLCGRLMCCLKYEQDGYEAAYKSVPKQGKEVMTPDGRGTITQIKAIKELVTVRVTMPDHTVEYRDYAFHEVEAAKPLTPEEQEQKRLFDEEAARLAEQRAEQRAQRAARQQQRPARPVQQRQKETFEEREARMATMEAQAGANGEGEAARQEKRPPRPRREGQRPQRQQPKTAAQGNKPENQAQGQPNRQEGKGEQKPRSRGGNRRRRRPAGQGEGAQPKPTPPADKS